MKIRTQITLLFSLITASILLIFATIIYISAKQNRDNEFYSLLKKEAITKANLYFKAKVPSQTLQQIYHNNYQTIQEVEVAVYDKEFHLLYHDAVDIDFVKETPEMIHEIYSKGEIKFHQGDWQVIGLIYSYNNNKYIITAAAYDQYGYNELKSLLRNSCIIFIFSILFIILVGYYFSKKVFQPIKNLTTEMKKISANHLTVRLKTKPEKDELSELAITFNQMLNRLENSFETQKHFVSNISHELRTPLAAIIAELELSLHHQKTSEEYQRILKNALSDAKKITKLSNNLLDLAKASYDPSKITFKPTRIDEILIDACSQIQQANAAYQTKLSFEDDFILDNETVLMGNEYLLKVAFINLIENGCKFSEDHLCHISISTSNSKLQLKFSDRGIGIPTEDITKIFTPFYRGKNKSFTYGNGIGLSLTKKIIELHSGTINVTSQLHQGTTLIILL
ncbi:sensor histidine kinase [Apibacter sp. B2966]|uniref:HAMP domain-containing sensor histidine kinase n=1 Tax=Apibacter sp. B2966 TaxID=2656761 RepID=UPI00140C1DFF|nr:HAMP domain-containing sensor histidine kinase [Apibacter sp. B2966]QII72129.1 HAMP domain-containing histidine kinase [Apibacter sp. B2966]